jgi:catechol 2,3-dioxygenase-like lactoylglutathione lyase family enzyme
MLRVSLLNVLVEDQDAAIGFYRDKLGFTLEEDLPFGCRPHRDAAFRLFDVDSGLIAMTLLSTVMSA